MKPISLRTLGVLAAWMVSAPAFLTASSTRCSAQSESADASRAAARQFGEQGIEAFRANDFVRADENLDKAYRLYPTPTLGLWSARAQLQLGRLVEASERLREATGVPETVGDAAAQKAAQNEAATQLEALLPRIPSVTVRLEAARPEEVRITFDGVALPSTWVGVARSADPGAHRLAATRGSERYETEVRLTEREQKIVLFKFQAVAPQPTAAAVPIVAAPPTAAAALAPTAPVAGSHSAEASPNLVEPIAIAALAVGGAGLLTSGIAFLVANNELDDCPDHECMTADAKSAYDSAKTVSAVAFYVGAAFAVGGAVALLVAPQATERPASAVSWGIGPSGVAVRGAF